MLRLDGVNGIYRFGVEYRCSSGDSSLTASGYVMWVPHSRRSPPAGLGQDRKYTPIRQLAGHPRPFSAQADSPHFSHSISSLSFPALGRTTQPARCNLILILHPE
jgi:hypothetical protein